MTMGKMSADPKDLVLTTKRKLIPSVHRRAPSESIPSNPEISSDDEPPKKVKKTTKKRTTLKEKKATGKKSQAAKTAKASKDVDSDIEEILDGGDNLTAVIDWKDVDLSFRLINAITEDPVIKRAPYPSIGPTPTAHKGGGKPKTDFQWKLCSILFEDDLKYGPAFQHALALTGKPAVAARSSWAVKIKNRLKVMETKTYEDIKLMGETGEGISTEDQINMDLDNQFTTKWDLIKSTAPWFFEMRSLISERPNRVPAGVGNGSSAIDTGLLMAPGDDTDVPDDLGSSTERKSTVESDSSKEDVSEKDDVSEKEDKGKEKIVKVKVDVHTKKTKAQAGISKPSKPARPSLTKPKNIVERFAEVAKVEEETVQRQLELKKLQMKGANDVAVMGIKAKAHFKVERDRRKSKLPMLKSKQDHEFCMAELQGRGGTHTPSNFLTGPPGSTSTDSPQYLFNFSAFDGPSAFGGEPSGSGGSSLEFGGF